MFCPNCGTENDDAATTCKKCGFNLKGAAAPKFKGTMLMMNTPPAQPRPPGAAPAVPGAPAPGAATIQGHSGPGAPAPAAARPQQLKGTMLGVAPPSLGAHGPGAPGAPPPAAPPVAQPGSPFGPTPAQAFGAQPVPAPMPAPTPGPGAVNPLGGTMVADPAGVGFNPYGAGGGPYGAPPGAPPAQPQGGFGAPPPGGFGGQPPAGGGYGAPPPEPGPGPGGFPPPGGGFGGPPGGGYGGPPPGGGGFGAPQQPGGYGSPPQGGGFGGAPGGFGAPQQPGGYGVPAPGGFGAPQPGGYGPPGGAPIVPSAGGARGPIGKTRNPVMVLVISMLCFVYAIIQLWGMLNELKAFRGKDDINPIMFFVPILGIIHMWNLPPKILEAKQMAGVPNAQVGHPILYFFLSLYLLPNDLNEIWQAAGGGQPR